MKDLKDLGIVILYALWAYGEFLTLKASIWMGLAFAFYNPAPIIVGVVKLLTGHNVAMLIVNWFSQ